MRPAILLACAGLLALSACGGGSPPSGTPESVQALAGLAPPAETPEDQFARAPGLLARSDSLILSTYYADTDSPRIPPFRLLSECSGAQCTVTNSITGQSQVVRISDLELTTDGTETLGTKHGVTLGATATVVMGRDVTAFGAWMDHSGFWVQTQREVAAGITIVARNGIVDGILTGARPAGSATWLGLMVGRPATGENRHDRLLGDAVLSYDIDAGALDAAFTGILNVDRNAAHSTTAVTFAGIPVGPEGTFEAGEAGNRIQGGFYGPGHAETAGVFERSNIVGAFGAKRSAQ